MIKRLFIISFFTGAGQLFSVFSLKYIAQYAGAEEIKSIAQIDSSVVLILNIIAMGLQTAAMRDLALADDWQQEYRRIQSARMALGLIMLSLCLLAFVNKYYLVFLLSPIIAWNGDYALYARGQSIIASIIAFLKVFIPFGLLLVMVRYMPHQLPWIYLATLAVTYIITNLSISYSLKTNYFNLPSFARLPLYLKSLSLGIVVLSLYFIGLGLILVIPYFYTAPVVALSFLGLRFYFIYKGILRIIHQAFIQEMVDYKVCFKVDQLASLLALAYCSCIICFPNTFVGLFFGKANVDNKVYFILLAIAALIYSLFSSLIIKAMLEKKDKQYAVVSSASAILTLAICIVLSFFMQTANAIGISLIAGETIFTISMLLLMKRSGLISERLLFLGKNLPFVAIPVAGSYLLGDTIVSLSVAMVLFTIAIMMRYYRRFNSSATL